MKAILARPDYELYGERQETGDSVSVNIYSVWPQARTDRSPNKLFSINLSKSEMRYAHLAPEHFQEAKMFNPLEKINS